MRAPDRDVVGREEEIAALADFLDAPTRLPCLLLLEGEAGIGKTTLWRLGVELAADTRLPRAFLPAGSSSEAQLSFVRSATSWVTPSRRFCPSLPRPQANALGGGAPPR